MSDEEFDVMDELYFVQGFQYLKDETGLESETLVQTLKSLWSKEWIKVLQDVDSEASATEIDLDQHHEQYLYLATKKGLLEHNFSS